MALLCVIAKAFQSVGYRALFVRCFNLFHRCYPMEIESMDYRVSSKTKRQLCELCAGQGNRYLGKFGFEWVDLRRLADRPLIQKVDGLMNQNPSPLESFSFGGHLFGKVALHDLTIRNKLTQYETLSEEVAYGHRQVIHSALLAYSLVQLLLRKFKISAIFHYNEWSMAIAASWAAEDSGVKRFTVSNLLADRRSFNVFPRYLIRQRWEELGKWKEWEALPLSAKRVGQVASEVISRMKGPKSHFYSPKKSTGSFNLEGIEIPFGKKVIVAYTSSGHEYLASTPMREAFGLSPFAFSNSFSSQFDWLTDLISFVESSKDLFLVVRVHPSEASNGESIHHRLLRERFSRSYKNSRWVWAGESISSYDLAEQANVVTMGWSTIGSELATIGVPVVPAMTATHEWPGSFIRACSSKEDYFSQLERFSRKNETSLEGIVGAYRWFYFNFYQGAIDVSDCFPDRETTFPQVEPSKDLTRILHLILEGKLDPSRHDNEELRSRPRAAAEIEECNAIGASLSRVIGLCTVGDESIETSRLGLSSKDEYICFQQGDVRVHRRSPMLVHLIKVFEESFGEIQQPAFRKSSMSHSTLRSI